MFLLFSFTRATYNYRHYQFKSSALRELNTLSFPSTVPCGGKVLKRQTMFVPFLKGSRGSKIGIARSAFSCIPYFRELLGKNWLKKKTQTKNQCKCRITGCTPKNSITETLVRARRYKLQWRCVLVGLVSPISKWKCCGADTMFLLPQWSVPALCLRLWILPK